MLWSITVVTGLTLAAYSLIEGFGFLVAVSGAILWLGLPTLKLIRYLIFGTKLERPNRIWFSASSLLTVVLIGCFLYFCPGPTVVSAPFVVDYEPLSVVRSKTAGFVKRIHVTDGQQVTAGMPLATLENLELEQELRSLAIDIEISRLTINTLFTQERISQMQLEEENLTAMQTRMQELKTQVADLQIVSPQTGIVLARDLLTKSGKYFLPGDELLSIGTQGKIQAIALAEQKDIEWIENNPDSSVELLIWGRHQDEVILGQIDRIDPRARDQLPHEAFSATVDGPLAVVPRQQTEGDRGQASDELTSSYRLTEQRVLIDVAIPDEERNRLFAGQTGQLMLRSRDENMGRYLKRKLVRFVSLNTHRTHGL